MDETGVLIPILKYVGLPGVIAGVFAWLIRTLLKEGLLREADRLREGLRRETETALAKLRHDTSQELEEFRHRLTTELEAHKVRYAHLQQRRIDHLLKVHSTLVVAVERATNLSTTIRWLEAEASEDEVEEVWNSQNTANSALQEAKLFLPLNLATKIDSLIKKIRNAYLTHSSAKYDNKSEREAQKAYQEEFAKFNAEALLEEVAAGIRELLGVEAR